MSDFTDEFIRYVKNEFGYNVSFKKSDNPDTFEKLYGARNIYM